MHEIKFDGYRVQVRVRDGSARILTRNGYDWTDRFSSIVRAATALSAQSFIIDGEAVVLDESGRPDMALLRASLAAGRGDRFTCMAFDLLYLDGADLRTAPLLTQKQLLLSLIGSAAGDAIS